MFTAIESCIKDYIFLPFFKKWEFPCRNNLQDFLILYIDVDKNSINHTKFISHNIYHTLAIHVTYMYKFRINWVDVTKYTIYHVENFDF